MKIKKGQKFRCIQTVVMEDGEVAYIKGKIYKSEVGGCITNMQSEIYHVWTDNGDDNWEQFFELIK